MNAWNCSYQQTAAWAGQSCSEASQRGGWSVVRRYPRWESHPWVSSYISKVWNMSFYWPLPTNPASPSECPQPPPTLSWQHEPQSAEHPPSDQHCTVNGGPIQHCSSRTRALTRWARQDSLASLKFLYRNPNIRVTMVVLGTVCVLWTLQLLAVLLCWNMTTFFF